MTLHPPFAASQWRSRVWLIGLLCVLCSHAEAQPEPPTVARPQAATGFDGERAFGHVRSQVAFGPRPSGSAALAKTRDHLRRQLLGHGLQVTYETFTPRTPRGQMTMKNIVAELPGESTDLIVIASHYDTKRDARRRFLGANDGASSTAALLEIARVLASAKPPPRLSYRFVFFDGEEAVCAEWDECMNGQDNTYGSRHHVKVLRDTKQLHRVKAMVLLDMVGDRDLAIARDENSTPWLVDTLWTTARELGHAAHFVERSHAMEDDHLPFLEAGIPAVVIIDFDYGEDNRYWHTEHDTIDKISARSLKIVGDVVVRSLKRIEAQVR